MASADSEKEDRGGPRCAAHNLAVGPDGLCVLCRQAARAAHQTGDGQSGGLTWLAFAVVTVCVLALAYGVAKQFSDRAEPLSAALRPPQPSAATANVPAAPAPESRAGIAAPVAANIDPVANAGPDDPRVGGPRGDRIPAPQERAAPAPQTVQQPPQPAPLTEEDLRLWMRRVPVIMYATDWCPHCAEARAWLHQNNISFTELDVEKSDVAKIAQRALNPAGGVPTLDIDGIVIVGFGPDSMKNALRRAAERRARQ